MENTTLFEQYLHNELSQQEKINFENRLASDPNFKLEFEKHHAIVQAVSKIGEEDMKHSLKTMHQSYKNQKWSRFGFTIFFMMIALTAIGIR